MKCDSCLYKNTCILKYIIDVNECKYYWKTLDANIKGDVSD